MAETVRIAHNAHTAKLLDASRELRDVVSDLLSYEVEGHEFAHSFMSGTWNGRSTFFSQTGCTFPAGFVHLVNSELNRLGHKVILVRRPLPEPLGPENPIVDEFGNDDPRYDYQLKALRQVERHGRGIIRIATGGGKSKVAKLIAARYRRMTMFLTTRGILMYQMADGFRDAGMNVGIIGDGTWSPVRGVNCGMVQTFVAKLKETTIDAEARQVVAETVKAGKSLPRSEIMRIAQERYDAKVRERNRVLKLLEMVEVVIGEEAHEAGGDSYYEILRHCKNANIRVALTATPFMRDDAEDNMRLMAAFGPILITVSEQQLIERGILSKPYFKYVKAEPAPKLRKTSPWQRARQIGIVEAPDRNRKVVEYAKKAASYGLPTLVLVQIQAHGKILLEMLRKEGIKAKFIFGEHKQDERKAALKELKDGKIQVLIGSTILDVGVDVPIIGMVILAGGGKAEVALRQRIGRALRGKKPPMPNVAFVVDFTDEVNIHLREHARQRRAIVEATPGFAENILKDNEDFDWSLFEAAKAA